ncbi:MAG: hypothetical protein WCK29_02585 [archaeon]
MVKDDMDLKRIYSSFTNYQMKKGERRIFIESVILIAIYFLSFGILSMGRVQQTFFALSQNMFSNLQMLILTFIFAVIATCIVYYLYQRSSI